MYKQNGKNEISKNKSFSGISFILLAIIGAVIAASIIVGAIGDGLVKRNESRRIQKQQEENDLRDLFTKQLTITDDDPDTDAITYFLTDSPNFKETGHIKVKGLMLHSIGATQTSGKKMAYSYGGSDFRYAGVHGFIDSETGVFYHTLPWSQQAWHAGDDAFDYIGVEMCETEAGYYSDDFVFHPEELEKAQENTRIAYESAVKLFARLCLKYGFDPMQDGIILSHKEGAMRGIATKHGDPEEYWENVKVDYTMDGFRRDVRDFMNKGVVAKLKYTPIRQILDKYVYNERY